MNNRIFIATPLYNGQVSYMYLRGVLETQKLYGDRVEFSVAMGTYLVINRETLLNRFLGTKCNYLLYIDSDIGWEASDVEKLVEADVECVAGGYLQRTGSNRIVAEPVKDGFSLNVDGLLNCYMVGAGFLMLKRKLVEDMAKTFRPVWSLDFTDEGYIGEDTNFCRKVSMMGIGVYLRPDVVLRHIGEVIFNVGIEKPLRYLGDKPL